ncbi:Microtubule-associated protein 70-5, partial [Cucurbita argyrosperma subsp. argyrosperma]
MVLKSEVDKLDDKLRATENLLEHKNLEIKRLTTEKKDAVTAQYAAEATLRRVYANQKDDDSLTLASVVAPLEAKIKMYKNEEENRILEKTNRQKVIEVERLGETIKDLEEAILAGGATANMVRDYKRQIEELHEEKRTLERELARAKVSVHRVATVVANEWKDESDRVMPEKFKLRLKTLEEGLRQTPASPINTKAFSGSPKTERSNNILGFLTSNGRKRSTSLSRPSAISKTNASDYEKATAPPELNRSNSLKKKYASACENVMKKSMWASGRSKVVDIAEKENRETIDGEGFREPNNLENEDTVSGFLYDKIQKEVINLRKLCEVKDGNLNTKDEEIKVLMKKVDALTKAMEVEAKKMKREAAVKEKEAAAAAAAGRLEEKNKPRMVHTKSRRLST